MGCLKGSSSNNITSTRQINDKGLISSSGWRLCFAGDASDPRQGALSEESERQVCETLRAVLSGMIESVAEMDDSDTASCMLAVLHHSLTAVAQLEASVLPCSQRKRRRADEPSGDDSGDSEARRWLEQELEHVQRQRLALDGEEAHYVDNVSAEAQMMYNMGHRR